MSERELGWRSNLTHKIRAYTVVLIMAIALFVGAAFCKSGSSARYVFLALGSGVLACLAFLILCPHDRAWGEHLKQRWRPYSVMAAAGVGSLVGANWLPSGGVQEVLYSMGSGLMGLLLFQTFTDYSNARFVDQVLDHYQVSFHVGARLYANHHDRQIPRRDIAIKQYLSAKDTIRLLTSTADDYVIPGSDAYDAIIDKLENGAKMQILLYTPIFNLKSFLDYKNLPGAEGHDGHGQHHLHASELVVRQSHQIIPAIKDLVEQYKEKKQVEAKFFYVQHHINMVIYGTKRIFSAPFLAGTSGSDLPCLEVFPGIVDSELFDKLTAEFDYIWQKPNLTISLDQMKEIYDFIWEEHSGCLNKKWISSAEADAIEGRAREITGIGLDGASRNAVREVKVEPPRLSSN